MGRGALKEPTRRRRLRLLPNWIVGNRCTRYTCDADGPAMGSLG